VVQPRLVSYLRDAASDPVDVRGHRLDAVRVQPAEHVGGVVATLAMAEDLPQSAGILGHALQQFIRGEVDEECIYE